MAGGADPTGGLLSMFSPSGMASPANSAASAGPVTVGGLTVPPYPFQPDSALGVSLQGVEPNTKILLVSAGVLVLALVLLRRK